MWNFCDAIGRERENFISHKYIEHNVVIKNVQ